ncbi:AI-2E family transporter [Patescibacteria group bacterium]|nr:AI-2E family transporter [Patescibacteria group bacterium]
MLKLFKNENSISVSPSIVIFTTFFLLFLYFLYQISNILVLFFLSFIIMVALHPFVQKLEIKLKFPRILAIIATYILVFLGIMSMLGLLIPPLAKQLYQFVRAFNLPWLQEEIVNFSFNLTELSSIIEQLGSSVTTIYSAIVSTFSSIFTVTTVLVISLFLMLDRKRLHLRVAWFTKNKQHIKIAREFIDSLEHQLGGWVRGQLILMLTIGLVTYVGLTLLSIPYAAPLALLAASLEILPNLGPTISAIPSIIIGIITSGPIMGLVVLVFYILVQQLENNLLVPKVMKENVDVSPLISIMSILIGLEIAGVIGALLAIPVYIVLRSVYSTWFKDLILS